MELGRYNTAAEAQRYVDMYGKGAKVKKEESDLEEASLKDIFTANQEGKKADEIAKKLGMSVSDIKKILGEEMGEVSEENLDEFTSDMIKRLKKSYSTMPQKLSTDQANALSRHLDRLDLTSLKQLAKEKIPFITTLARNKVYKKTGKFEELEEQDGVEIAKIRADRDEKNKKEVASKEKEVESLKNQVNMLKTKLENEKNKAIKPEPNPETGEVPLTIGIAHAEFKKEKEKKEVKEENLQELSKAERDKRIQRAKDMIKYYDAQKKAALKGPNKALAKKMLKNETELEEVSQKEIDKFHTDLDNLVHKTFGHSSDEKMDEKMDEKVASSIIRDLQKAYAPMKGKTISPEMANKISKHLDQPSYDLNVLRQLKKADIPFISTIARNKIYKKTGKFEDRRLYVEGIAGLQKKADKSGMPYSILKKVYDRGMAAWISGHRPGASQQQWAFARVNSFITKSSGTWGGADKDLAAKVKGSK